MVVFGGKLDWSGLGGAVEGESGSVSGGSDSAMGLMRSEMFGRWPWESG